MRGVATFSVAISLGLAPTLAEGHGPPEPLSVNFGLEENELLVGTSFGVLRSEDGGATWWWLCEAAVGYSDLEIIPRWAWLDDGTLAATTTNGVSVSQDGGCTWSRPTETVGNFTGDLQKHPTEPLTLIAALRDMVDGTTSIVRTTDGAATFSEVLYSATGRYVTTVSYAPSDPQQIYAAAISAGGELAWVLHSPDGGETWNEHAFYTRVTFIRMLGVDPTNPAIVYVASHAPDAIQRSSDSGETFEEVMPGFAQAFVTSADGQRVWASEFEDGLFLSDDRGLTFSPVDGAPSSKCLTRRGNAIYACGNPDKGESIVLRSDDGTTFEPIMASFADMDTALSCPAGTTANDDATCAPSFPQLLCSFGGGGEECDEINPPPDDPCGCSAPGSSSPAGPLVLAALVGWALRRKPGRRGPRSRG